MKWIVKYGLVGLALSTTAFGQVGGSKAKLAGTPIRVRSATSQKLSTLTKVYGIVVREGVKDKVITIGMPNQGPIQIDVRSAIVRGKDGRMLSLSKISPGSNLTATGKMSGSFFRAKEVRVNYIRPAGAVKPSLGSTQQKGTSVGKKTKAGG